METPTIAVITWKLEFRPHLFPNEWEDYTIISGQSIEDYASAEIAAERLVSFYHAHESRITKITSIEEVVRTFHR